MAHSPELLQAEIERQRRQIELLQTRNSELNTQIDALRGLVSAMLKIVSRDKS